MNQIDTLVSAVENWIRSKPVISRADFREVTLAEVLAQPDSLMAIYFAMEKYPKYEKAVLRIHNVVGTTGGEYLWFEKAVPQRLEREDVLPWVRSMIVKLPKKKQPKNIEAWMKKLLDSHAELKPWKAAPGEKWNEMPRLILVFGTAKEVGLVAHWHLERRLIESFMRRGDRVEIRASLRLQYDSEQIEHGWVFYLFTPTPDHAEKLERRMLSGEEIHFPLGPSIRGIAAKHGNRLDCIGLDHEMIEKEFAQLGAVLVSHDPPRQKHKAYTYRAAGEAGTGASRMLGAM